jgi:hypothetical protein
LIFRNGVFGGRVLGECQSPLKIFFVFFVPFVVEKSFGEIPIKKREP